MKPPPLTAYTRVVPREPDLIGVTEDGDLLDLDGGTITYHPDQSLRWTTGFDRAVVEEGRPRRYTLTFTKPANSPWSYWFRQEINSAVPFRVSHLRMRIESMQIDDKEARFVAQGWEEKS